jgi:hypothetical protein
MSIVQWITLVIAVFGAVLGVINTWRAMDRDRVKIRVTPKIAFVVDVSNSITVDRNSAHVQRLRAAGLPEKLAVEMVNLSNFPVTMSDAGFGRADQTRQTIFRPELTSGKTWPVRLEPREAVTAFTEIGIELDPAMMTQPIAYAKTDCGTVRYGTSSIFKEYVKSLRTIGGKQ